MSDGGERFWESAPLRALDPGQWESLCDGCAKCCLEKFEDEDTGEMVYTNIACRLLDLETCRCSDYARRQQQVPECIALTPASLEDPRWLPQTCAYRLVAKGQPLAAWHPLLSGDAESVRAAGQSVYGRVIPESEAEDPLMHLIDWIR